MSLLDRWIAMVTYLSTMRMTLATKASRWKICFYRRSVLRKDIGDIGFTHSAHLDSVLVEGGPLDDLGLESVINFWYQLEGQGLRKSALVRG
jgi:hypothetical protein